MWTSVLGVNVTDDGQNHSAENICVDDYCETLISKQYEVCELLIFCQLHINTQ